MLGILSGVAGHLVSKACLQLRNLEFHDLLMNGWCMRDVHKIVCNDVISDYVWSYSTILYM